MGQANGVGPTSIKGSFSSIDTHSYTSILAERKYSKRTDSLRINIVACVSLFCQPSARAKIPERTVEIKRETKSTKNKIQSEC